MKIVNSSEVANGGPVDHLGAAGHLLREREYGRDESPGWHDWKLPTEQEAVTAAAHALTGIGRHLDGISVALARVADVGMARGVHVTRTAAVAICVASATGGGAVGALLTASLGS